MNGSRIDHNLHDVTKNEVEFQSAQAEFKSEWWALCKMLGITPNLLHRLDTHVVVALILCRLHKLYTSKFHQHENAMNVPNWSERERALKGDQS